MGLPVLAIGPSNLSSIKWVDINKAGIVVDSDDKNKILCAIDILSRIEERKTRGESAFAAFRRYHESRAVRQRFYEVLLAATQRNLPQ
jgi:hypothetical protein